MMSCPKMLGRYWSMKELGLRMSHDELPKDVRQILEHEVVGAQDVT